MKVSLDTTIIVDIERGNQKVVEIFDFLISRGTQIFVSSVVLSEVFTGTYLREDYKKAVQKAKKLFSLFEVVSLDSKIAEIIGEINAYLISNGMPVEYQDIAVAATFLHRKGDYLLTENIDHFSRLPGLKERVYRPEEFKPTGL